MAFTYKGTFTVTSDSAKLASTQADFPVLVAFTDNALKTVANGGFVANANGYDIRFFSDSGLSSAVPFELESYDGSAGTIVIWVKIASLALSGVFYAGFGDAALNTNASSALTWNSDYANVYHYADGSSLAVADSTSNARNLTNSGATATTGQIDGAANFASASSQYMTSSAFSLGANTVTISAWVYSTNFNIGMIVLTKSVNVQWTLFFEPGQGLVLRGNDGSNALKVAKPSDNNWHHVAGTISGTTGVIYLDGAATPGTVAAFTDASSAMFVGAYGTGAGNYNFNGKIDEPRVSKVARSADWITAEYYQTPGSGFLSAAFAALAPTYPQLERHTRGYARGLARVA